MKNMNISQHKLEEEIIGPYYKSHEAINKTKVAIDNFLYVNIMQGSNIGMDKLSVRDIYYNTGISKHDKKDLLHILYFALGKNKDFVDLNSHQITQLGIQKIKEIIYFTNKYYEKFKPFIIKYIDNKLQPQVNIYNLDTSDKILSFFETLTFANLDKENEGSIKKIISKTKKVFKKINESENLIDINTKMDFINRSVFGGYCLLFYIISHLYLSKEFINREEIFNQIINSLGIKDHELQVKEDIIGHTFHLDKEEGQLGKNNFRIIGNTKGLKSTIEKLLHDRAYDFVTDFKDIYRFTIIKNNIDELVDLMIYFYEKFPNAKIVDKGMSSEIYNKLKNNDPSEFKVKIKQSIKDNFEQSNYADTRFIIEFQKGINFELKFMTENLYEKSKNDKRAADEIYKIIGHLHGKSRSRKALTKDFIIDFIVKKINKGHNKINIVDKIFAGNTQEAVSVLVDKINNNFDAISHKGNGICYIHKNEFINLSKLNYLPESFQKTTNILENKITKEDVLKKLTNKKHN